MNASDSSQQQILPWAQIKTSSNFWDKLQWHYFHSLCLFLIQYLRDIIALVAALQKTSNKVPEEVQVLL